ncbi:MAG: DUF5674 family protein [bacterium]|nr:DUF5674 family protein [bacterium]
MEIRIIKDKISIDELKQMAKSQFGDFVKAVVDVGQGIMAVGGELHADEQTVLAEKENSKWENSWGINIYPEQPQDKMIEFDSMVNIKPQFNNMSRSIANVEIQNKIKEVLSKLIS